MKRYIYLLFILFLLNCNNERIVQLPEIENAKITEVEDVSPAYIFYDETQPDSTLFNRKNLIGTTNWLVNVDKRLTLKQAIPHIQYLQDKRKKASMHKNEDAKNYFTCNDTSMGSLGFVEFTDVDYVIDEDPPADNENLCFMLIKSISDIYFSLSVDYNFNFTNADFNPILKIIRAEYGQRVKIVLIMNSSINFQDYITIKNTLQPFNHILFKQEFIY